MTCQRLTAGPLQVDYDSGDLRCIRLGNQEIVRRIYVVFQDRNWTARPWIIESESIEAEQDSFQIDVRARGTFDASPFTWRGHVTGSPDGEITYSIEGDTPSAFLRNRLGICLLHPMAGFSGRACTIGHASGETSVTAFPDHIAAHQPFMDVRWMEYPAADGVDTRLDFSGEVFETEDHRNWSDASYKTYCTPIALSFPVEVTPEDVIRQSVRLTLNGVGNYAVAPTATESDAITSGVVTIDVGANTVPLPLLGTQITDLPWSDDEVDSIRHLGLNHLLITIDATGPDPAADLRAAYDVAIRTATRLHVRLVDADDSAYASLRPTVDEVAPLVDSWMILRRDESVTSSAQQRVARDALGADLPWCAGTDHYFTEINRQHPDMSGATWLAFSLNPQVHAHDDRSILQNTASQAIVARDATSIAHGARLHIGPVSLRPRFNPNATDPDADVSSTDLPASVDDRQRTWLGAAWTALSLRALAGSVDAVTYFEALGWRGLRERDSGSADPGAFPSGPGEEFPVYGLLRALEGFSLVHPTTSDQPEVADALILASDTGQLRALILNLEDSPRSIRFTGTINDTIEVPPLSLTSTDLIRSAL